MSRAAVPVGRPDWGTFVPASRPKWADFNLGRLAALAACVAFWVLVALYPVAADVAGVAALLDERKHT